MKEYFARIRQHKVHATNYCVQSFLPNFPLFGLCIIRELLGIVGVEQVLTENMIWLGVGLQPSGQWCVGGSISNDVSKMLLVVPSNVLLVF